MTPDAPFFAEVASAPDGAQPFWLRTSDEVRIRVVAWHGGTRGTAYVFPGRTEYIEKYGPVVGRLRDRGLSVIVIDWRGQGLSDRLGRTHAEGHVIDFREFQQDVAAMLSTGTDLGLAGPNFIFAHSMGGCIALRTLMERSDFSGAVISAPMWRLQLRTALREMHTKAQSLLRLIGLHRQVSPVSTTEPGKASDIFANNPLTSDPDAFAWARAQVEAHPELALGPPAASWTRAAFTEMFRLDFRPLPDVPILVMLGSEERIVSQSKIRARAGKLPRARLIEFPGGRHELFLERAEIRDRIWENADALIADVEASHAA